MFFTDLNYITLILMLGASLFFMMAGIRSLKSACIEGLLFFALSLFFAATHFFYFYNLPIDSPLSFTFSHNLLWSWLTFLFAPALIILFISFGLVNFVLDYFRVGLIKIFFGLTLLCYIFMIGNTWAFDIRGIITIIFCFIWFEVELKTAV